MALASARGGAGALGALLDNKKVMNCISGRGDSGRLEAKPGRPVEPRSGPQARRAIGYGDFLRWSAAPAAWMPGLARKVALSLMEEADHLDPPVWREEP